MESFLLNEFEGKEACEHSRSQGKNEMNICVWYREQDDLVM